MQCLDTELLKFNLSLDHAKTQYIRFGGETNYETISLWPKPIMLEKTDEMKWLGFYLYDNDVFNAKKHTLRKYVKAA